MTSIYMSISIEIGLVKHSVDIGQLGFTKTESYMFYTTIFAFSLIEI